MFSIGMTFAGSYPGEAAAWCNQNGAMIVRTDAGEFAIRPAPARAPLQDRLMADLRAARDARLAATDCLVLPDYPIPDDQRAAVQAYRQALRDLPAREGAPWDGGGEGTPWPELTALKA